MAGREYLDDVYGSVTLDDLQEQLSKADALTQTTFTTQLGLAQQTYASAEHSRYIHNLGASILGGKFGAGLHLGELDRITLESAGILHDIGHPPFSHACEYYFRTLWGFTQEQLSSDKILAPGEIHDILRDHRVNPQLVADLIFEKNFNEKYNGRQRYMKQLISGDMDVDRMDYLLRDALRTAPFGKSVDYQRMLQSSFREDHPEFGDIVVYDEDCIAAIQQFFSAYSSMYMAVYYNPNVKNNEKFLEKALFLAHDYLFERFMDCRQDPSLIREQDIVEALQEIPSDNKNHLIAKDIINHIFDKKKKFTTIAFLRMGYEDHQQILAKINAAFPMNGLEDTLEKHLVDTIPDAREGEIIVIRNPPNSQKKEKDVFVKLRHSGFGKPKIVPVNTVLDLTSFQKHKRHRHSLRVVSVHDVYAQPALELLESIV